MHTKDKLAKALMEADLGYLAAKARDGIYHDFLSPLPDPASELDRDLLRAGTPAALELRRRHHLGEWDATKEEADDWAMSAEGRDVFGQFNAPPRGFDGFSCATCGRTSFNINLAPTCAICRAKTRARSDG